MADAHPEPEPFDAPAALPRGVGRALNLLLNASQKVSLDELASHAGMSKYHLARLFSRHVGQPPLRFQNERRLQNAAVLLREGKKPIDVANDLGFADQSHLNRLFKRRFGVPPSGYARSSRC